jgi:hypothetical protein
MVSLLIITHVPFLFVLWDPVISPTGCDSPRVGGKGGVLCKPTRPFGPKTRKYYLVIPSAYTEDTFEFASHIVNGTDPIYWPPEIKGIF